MCETKNAAGCTFALGSASGETNKAIAVIDSIGQMASPASSVSLTHDFGHRAAKKQEEEIAQYSFRIL